MTIDSNIVAMVLDQSPLNTGWSVASPLDLKPTYGLYQMPTWKDQESVRLCTFEDWLIGQIQKFGVTHLGYESPVDMHPKIVYIHGRATLIGVKSFEITSMQNMQIGAILMAARRCKIPVQQVPVDSWRLRFLGTTKLPVEFKGEEARKKWKAMALDACAVRGWLVDDDNVAESLGILDFFLSTLSQRHAGHRDPIFRRAELQQDVKRFRGEA